MAARTPLTLVAPAFDGAAALGAGATPDAVNGNTVAAGPYNVIIQVKNADSASHNLTIRAGGSGNTASGAAAVATPFEQASTGDLVIAITNGTTQVITIANNDRFTQADGSLSLDWSSATSMTVWVIQKPKAGLG